MENKDTQTLAAVTLVLLAALVWGLAAAYDHVRNQFREDTARLLATELKDEALLNRISGPLREEAIERISRECRSTMSALIESAVRTCVQRYCSKPVFPLKRQSYQDCVSCCALIGDEQGAKADHHRCSMYFD